MMSETELQIMRETQQLLDERLKLLDAEMATFLHLHGPARAVAAETWFRSEIAQAVTPLLARIMQLETKPTAATFKPPQEFIDAVGTFVAGELAERDARILQLEAKIANWKFCGTWSPGQYEPGNHINHDGSTFVCLWTTAAKPGTDSSWQLVAKRGKDGKDLRVAIGKDLREENSSKSEENSPLDVVAAARQPTLERSYGR